MECRPTYQSFVSSDRIEKFYLSGQTDYIRFVLLELIDYCKVSSSPCRMQMVLYNNIASDSVCKLSVVHNARWMLCSQTIGYISLAWAAGKHKDSSISALWCLHLLCFG